MEKCGGTSLRTYLKNIFPGAIVIATQVKHATYRRLYESIYLDRNNMVKNEYYTLPAFGTTRNPWSWYVSLYHDDKRNGGKFYKAVCGNKNIGCKEFIKKILDPSKELKNTLFLPNKSQPPIKRSILGKCADNNIGLFSYYSINAFSLKGEELINEGRAKDAKYDVKLLKIEKFVNEFQEFLHSIGVNKPIKTMIRKNVTEHLHYSRYYDDELIKLVSKLDGQHIKKYGYVFERK